MRYLASIAAVFAAVSFAGTAQAAITIHTSLASFNAATSAQGTDTYNNLLPGAPLAESLNRSAGAYTYTVSDSLSVLYSAGSTGDVWLSNDSNAGTITFNNFSAGVRGIGANFFGSDVNGAFAASPLGLTITATDASGTVTQTIFNATQTTFLGFTSTGALTQLTIRATVPESSYWATVNNLVLGQAAVAQGVPEPATWAMMMVGFGLLGGAMRRRSVRVSYAAA